jgi:hypothetical protein
MSRCRKGLLLALLPIPLLPPEEWFSFAEPCLNELHWSYHVVHPQKGMFLPAPN